jgi:hypothetical protein
MNTHSGCKVFTGIIATLALMLAHSNGVAAESELILSNEILTGYTMLPPVELDESHERKVSMVSFRDQSIGNITDLKETADLRVRGWQVKNNMYFGQTKVADRWGVGLFIKRKDIVYGINNRGVQILKKF